MRKPPIPHKFKFYGLEWTVRWGSKTDKDWDAANTVAQVNLHKREIILHPMIRRSRAKSWEALMHEVFHIIELHEDRFRKKLSRYERERIAEHVELSRKDHDAFYRLDVPLGRFLAEVDAYIPCICGACAKSKAKEEGKIGKGGDSHV